MPYTNYHPWMTDYLRTTIKEKNGIILRAYTNPEDQRLIDDYNREKNLLILKLRNKENLILQ